MSKLSSGAEPFVPKVASSTSPSAAAAKTSLSAVATPFNPTKKSSPALTSASTSTSAPTPIAPTPITPIVPKAVEAAANSGLSATAVPYNPTRTSPTSKGTPTFPSAPSTAAATTCSEAPVLKESPTADSPEALSTIDGPSSSASESASNNFAASTLVVNTPKAAVASGGEVPKFSHSWGLICNNHLDPKNYTGVEIRRVGDIEQFWRLWQHVPLFSSKVSTSAASAYTYHWFKGMIKPSWEDPSNKDGGIMTIPIVTSERVSYLDAKGRTVIDDAYLSAIMLVTGCAKAAMGIVNGITIKSRNGVALDLWLDTTDADKIKAMVAVVREQLLPIDGRFSDKFTYMSNSQRVASPPSTSSSGYKGKVAKVEKKVELY